MNRTPLMDNGRVFVEKLPEGDAFLVINGFRAARMSTARAVGIVAALQTPEGAAAFAKARDDYNAANGDNE